MYYHRVWAEVDLDAASYNLEQLKTLLPAGAAIMVVVKANAYGHGAVQIARHLQHQGIWGFGVGDSHEALELRESGITCPILILGAIIEDEIEKVVKNAISVCIHSAKRVERLDREAQRQRKHCRVHLMVDTGMGRLGIFPEMAPGLASMIAAAPGLLLEGVATHYSSTSDPDDPFTGIQLQRFLAVREDLFKAGIRPCFFHASNSGALLSHPPEPFNLVRAGIALYGLSASERLGRLERRPSLKPVLSLKTQIIYMKDVPPGTPVGYDRLYHTPGRTRIATLPVGYNDGFPYGLSDRGRVLVHGRSAPVVGAVSMDYTMIDVGHIEGASVGDRVTCIGQDGEERIRVEDLARWVGTIPYEITCGIGKRVRRVAVDRSDEPPRPLTNEGAKQPGTKEAQGSKVEMK